MLSRLAALMRDLTFATMVFLSTGTDSVSAASDLALVQRAAALDRYNVTSSGSTVYWYWSKSYCAEGCKNLCEGSTNHVNNPPKCSESERMKVNSSEIMEAIMKEVMNPEEGYGQPCTGYNLADNEINAPGMGSDGSCYYPTKPVDFCNNQNDWGTYYRFLCPCVWDETTDCTLPPTLAPTASPTPLPTFSPTPKPTPSPTSPTLSPTPSPTCLVRKTREDESTGLVYLDRHEVDCSAAGSGVTQFKLHTEADKMRYEYKCCGSALRKESCTTKETAWEERGPGSGSNKYLDRHTIECAFGSVIQKFKLESDDTKIRFKYTCCELYPSGTVSESSTPSNDNGGENVKYLDRHNVECAGSSQLMKLKLAVEEENIHFDFSCFAPSAPTETPTPLPSASPTETPTPAPSPAPTETPTPLPSASPTETPAPSPSPAPTATPTPLPSASPTETPTPSPSPAPTATPTPFPSASPTDLATSTPTQVPTSPPTDATMTGDPHVSFNGTRTTIHLPTNHFTKLLEQGEVALYALGGADGGAHMNHMVAVSVRIGGVEAVRIDQRPGLLTGNSTLYDISMANTRDVLQVNATRDRVTVLHAPSGLRFVVASRPTTMVGARNSHHLNLRLGQGIVLASSPPGAEGAGRPATGALPQIWGTEAITRDVAKLVLHTKRLAEDDVSSAEPMD